MNKVALLIGGNQGNRLQLIHQATELIRQRIGSVVALSAIYETEPWGDFEDFPLAFLNQAMLVETTLSAHEVLYETQKIEAVLGRMRSNGRDCLSNKVRTYHSRTMDIDLIFWNDEVIDSPDLTIPHPRAHLRRFVLEPLSEIMPDYCHPILQKKVCELLKEV